MNQNKNKPANPSDYIFSLKTSDTKSQYEIENELRMRFGDEMSEQKIASLAKAIWEAINSQPVQK